MASNNESQCYFVQLQFDSYLDGELSQTQREEFQSHVHKCQLCASEFKYAQTVYDFVLELPQLDCDDHVLEPIHRLGGGFQVASTTKPTFWKSLQELFTPVPMFVRYAFATALLVVLVLPLVNLGLMPSSEMPPLVAELPAGEAPQYTPQEIQQALAELNLAIQYLNEVGQRTEVMIGDRFIVTPIQESLDASFEVMRRVNADPLQDDPI